MIAATIACALACVLLVIAEARGFAMLRVLAKLVASASFVTVGLLAFDGSRYAGWIVVGLGLGALGDAALLGHGKRAFLAGLGAFLLGHVAYVVALAGLAPPVTWLGSAGAWAIAPIGVGVVVIARLWRRLGTLRLPVVAYVATIVAMVIGALAVARDPVLPLGGRQRLAIGALLFFASDLAVARERFVARTFANKLWGLPAYFASQLLIAWSIAPS